MTKDGTMRGKMSIARGGLILAALFLGVLSIGPGEAQAQQVRDWNQTVDPLEGGIGLHYGDLGGTGLSFRVPLQWYLYFQAGGGIWHTEDDQKHNAGAQLNFLLRQDPRLRLYLSGGVGYFYHREKTGTSGGRDLWEKSKNWNVGAGVGTEYLIGPRVALQVELDFVHEGEDGDVKVSPQLGLHFYW